jgi:hypothetical protein
MEHIPRYYEPAVYWDLLPATRLASRKILIEQNIKRRTGPALHVLSLLGQNSHQQRELSQAPSFPSTVSLNKTQ